MTTPRLCDECHARPRAKSRRRLCVVCFDRLKAAGTLDTLHPSTRRRPPSPVEGVSYRQLDDWARRGLLRPDNPSPGRSGWKREWSEPELAVAAMMGRLVAGGLTVDAAHRVARGVRVLGPGIRLVIDEEEHRVQSDG